MTAQLDADRRQMADFLARHGPATGDLIREQLGWTTQLFWDAVYGPNNRWFMITIDGWTLTEAGKSLIAAPYEMGAFA